MWIWITFVLVGAYVILATHELSHVLVNKLIGRNNIEIVLWPHVKNGKFYFARVRSKGPTKNQEWVHLSPVLKSVLFIPVWVLLSVYWYTPFCLFAVWEVIDILWWLKTYFWGPNHLDGAKYRAKVKEA